MSNFKSKDKLDEITFRLFNILSDIKFIFNFRLRAFLSNNIKFKNKHRGQRCFIIGTGPSLKKLSGNEIKSLENEIVFGVNSIYKVPFLSSIRPSYYVLADNNYWGVAKYTFEDIKAVYSDCPPTFITDVRACNCLKDENNALFFYAKNYPLKNEFRGDFTKNISITMNVVGFSIIAAIYMGFKEIYLLGCDYNLFCQNLNSHCYDDEREKAELPKYNLAFYLKYYAITTEFHYHIADFAKNNGVKIINITDGSLLDSYPFERSSSILN